MIEETGKLVGTRGMLQLADGIALDLADAFSGDRKDLAHLRQGVGISIRQAVAEANDLPLAVVQRLQALGQFRPSANLG